MARKQKNIIDVDVSRKFLYQVYGLKSQIVTDYHLKIVHEEYHAIFNWYHTTGKVVVQFKSGKHINIGFALTDEDVAILICDHAQSEISQGRHYWNKPRGTHSPASIVQSIYDKAKKVCTPELAT